MRGTLAPTFRCLALTPGSLADYETALAAARAGGVGMVDAAHCTEAELAAIAARWQDLLAELGPEHEIGLRLRPDQVEAARPLVEAAAPRPLWIVLACGPEAEAAANGLDELDEAILLAEAGSSRQAEALCAALPRLDGLVACGQECGGWAGEHTSFVLLQSLSEAPRPIYVRGGLGVHGAAACRAAGAAGVVLDDQLLLLRESPLPGAWRAHLEGLSGQEARLLGARLGAGCRVLWRPQLAAAGALERAAAELEGDGRAAAEREADWRRRAAALMGWGPPAERAWPIGQAVGLAAAYREIYGTVGRLLQALGEATTADPADAARLQPLAAGAPLARAHGTRYPIVQGPMTRVSDGARFARAVAEAGALPMLALALMRAADVRELLKATRADLGERPWGVGILGFVPAEVREAQLAEVRRVKPGFALIAGGQPHQVKTLEDEGIAAYAHVPAPGLLEAFLGQGVRRFVFEGQECGGHIGPLSSFVLWESMIAALLARLPESEAEACHVLFAGGIHDAASAAMVSVLAAPLARRGVKVGVLMGTAYTFTHEAVETGAIVPGFQDVAVACERTVLLEAGVGHANRCAATDFAREYDARRAELLREARPVEEVRAELDALQLGRLRAASKGLERAEGGELATLEAADQRRHGMYMLGDLASIRTRLSTLAELHAEVSEAAAGLQPPEDSAAAARPAAEPAGPAQVAIIGMSLLVPQAREAEGFWANILACSDAITEVPREYWDWRLYYDPDRRAPDRMYSKWGGFFGEVAFDPLEFGIPPVSMNHISVSQLLALRQAKLALEDAGYGRRPFDRENTAVIVASADNGGYLGQHFVTRSTVPLVEAAPDERALHRLAGWSEESFAGILTNVTAGRVANRFDLGGPNFTVDSACAAGLTALDLGVRELECGRSNLALVGGVDVGQTPFAFMGFSKTQALSPDGRAKVFDRSADGIVISEGIVIMVLKRLAEAERDGDRIYAVVQAVAGSSDGKGLSMTAPKPQGQMRALRRAYAKAGFPASTIQLYEAHGTGTAVGDEAELTTVTEVLTSCRAVPAGCAVGSVKSLLGHTKTAAGLVGLAKAALALHHRVLPPHAGVERPLEPIIDTASPVYLLDAPKPWLAPREGPRRAGVSGFGFGGTNAHAVLEEYTGGLRARDPNGDARACELLAFAGASRGAVAGRLRAVEAALADGAAPRLRDLASSCAAAAAGESEPAIRAALVAGDLEEVRRAIAEALAALQGGGERAPSGAALVGVSAGADPGRLAFLFPGQGSQAVGMGREAALCFGELHEALEAADRVLAEAFPKRLSDYLYPPQAFTDEARERQLEELTDTHVAQPAIGALSAGLLRLLESLGLHPDMVAGHSYGEYTALFAAGALDRADFLRLSEARGRHMAACTEAEGAMAAAFAERAVVERAIADEADVVVANHNAPDQAVISGPRQGVERAAKRLAAQDVRVLPLAVANAFHSPLMRSAEGPLGEIVAGLDLAVPRCPVYSNATSEPYLGEVEEVRAQLAGHLLAPVEFTGQIEAMYRDGARSFVEVGPGARLSGLVGRILGERPYLAVATDAGEGGLRGLLGALGRLFVAGVDLRLERLFERRDAAALDLSHLLEAAKERPPAGRLWRVNGMRARPPEGTAPAADALPELDLETMHKEKTEAGGEAAPAGREAGIGASGDPMAKAYAEYQATMRQFLRTQEAVMQHVLGGAAGEGLPWDAAAATAQAPPPPASPEPPAPPAGARESVGEAAPAEAAEDGGGREAAVGRDGLARRLVAIVVERTGYPADMLGFDLDIEAELGIDSIKRAEIVDAAVRALPGGVRARLQEQINELIRVKTLSALLERLLEAVGGEAAPPAPPAAPAEPADNEVAPATGDGAPADGEARADGEAAPAAGPATAAGRGDGQDGTATVVAMRRAQGLLADDGPPAEAGCPRYLMRAVSDPMPLPVLGRAAGLYVITADGGGVAAALARLLEEHGAHSAILEPAACDAPEGLAERLAALRAEHGPVRGLIHLVGLAAEAAMPERLGDWRWLAQRHCKSLYRLLALCREDLGAEGHSRMGRVVAASALGGRFGREPGGAAGLPLAAGSAGLVNTVDIEWPSVLAKCVDFDPAMGADAMARALFTEMLFPGGRIEVGYPGGRRTVFRPAAAPLDRTAAPAGPRPEADWVVLATGGARGVTAEVVAALAVPGMRLFLVGRAPEPEAEPAALAACRTAEELRARLIEEARAERAGAKPAEVESWLAAALRARELRANLARLREAGAAVEYHAIDVRDEGAFGGLVTDIYERFGRLDAVLHGAGLIEDKRLGDKDAASLDRVFDTKVDGAFLLWRYLRPEGLKLVMLFASTAGRFGNPGQADYAAANEVLNRLAWRMRAAWPESRVVAVNWGPWGEVGMAGEAVRRQFRARGIVPVGNADGRRFAREEVLYGGLDDVEVIAGEGPWHVGMPALSESFLDLDSAAATLVVGQ